MKIVKKFFVFFFFCVFYFYGKMPAFSSDTFVTAASVITQEKPVTLEGQNRKLDWKKLHEQADKLNISDALKAAKNDSVESLYVLGLVFLNTHQNQKAEEAFNKLLKKDPEFFQARWGLAEVFRRDGKPHESIKILDEVLKQNKNFSPALITLAYIKYTSTDFKGALSLAEKVINQGRTQADISNLARAYLIEAGGRGMLAYNGGPLAKVFNGTKVFSNLKKAQRLRPGSVEVLFGFGSFYFLAPRIAGGDASKAEDCFKKVIKADPLFADAYVRLAQVYQIQGKKKEAESYLKKALSINPGNYLANDAMSKKCKFACVTLEE